MSGMNKVSIFYSKGGIFSLMACFFPPLSFRQRLIQHPPHLCSTTITLSTNRLKRTQPDCLGTQQRLLPLTLLSIATVSHTHMHQIRGQGSWVVLGSLNGVLCVIIPTFSNLSLRGSCQKKLRAAHSTANTWDWNLALDNR